MIQAQFKSIFDLLKRFPDEQACIDHLEKLRWSRGVISPYDSSSKVYKLKNSYYKCKNTDKRFNVRVGTMFENSKLPLQKWFVAIYLVTTAKKGISSPQLATQLHITQKTAWFLLHRIRTTFGLESAELSGEVEADETYIGGKNKNRHKDKKIEGTQGRSAKDKAPVLGILQRGGKVVARKVEGVSRRDITPEVTRLVKEGSTVYTDEWVGYGGISAIYDHLFVKHNQGEYVNGRIHTNTIEGFWAQVKRTVMGTHHFLSKKHLQRYINEMMFKYNERHETQSSKVHRVLINTEHRLKYKQLIGK